MEFSDLIMIANYWNSGFDFIIKIRLTTESNVIGNPISQLIELLIGTHIATPKNVNKLTPNIDGLMNRLFTTATPANKPNANAAIANMPKDKKYVGKVR